MAKALLENQRSQLRQRVLHHLEVAYGIDRQSTDSVDTSHELSEHFQSLWPPFDPQPPVSVNLKDAMQHLLEQALEHQYPAHPKFEAPPKGSNLKKVYDEVHKATEVSRRPGRGREDASAAGAGHRQSAAPGRDARDAFRARTILEEPLQREDHRGGRHGRASASCDAGWMCRVRWGCPKRSRTS